MCNVKNNSEHHPYLFKKKIWWGILAKEKKLTQIVMNTLDL